LNFIAPIMLLGTIGIAIPIAIHLWSKQSARRIPFAAVDFLIASDEKASRRIRLSDLLLLIARIAICMLVPLILAQPYGECEHKGIYIAQSDQAVAIVIDNSYSGSYPEGEDTLFEKSKTSAEEILRQLTNNSHVILLQNSNYSSSNKDLVSPSDALRTLKSFKQRWLPSQLSSSINVALAALQKSQHQRKTLYLFTPILKDTKIQEISGIQIFQPKIYRGITNTAITRLSSKSQISKNNYTFEGTFNNFSKVKKECALTLIINNQKKSRASITIDKESSISKTFSVRSLPEDTFVFGELQSNCDSLQADNRRFIYLVKEKRSKILIVNGDPKTVRHKDELFYLYTALKPGSKVSPNIEIQVTNIENLEKITSFEDYDLLILANTPPLDGVVTKRIRSAIERGLGVFASLGTNYQPESYNSKMQTILPFQFQAMVDLLASSSETEKAVRYLNIAQIEYSHPIFSLFSEPATELKDAKFSRIVLISKPMDHKKSKILARYSNHSPAILEASIGDGKVVLFTSTLDRDWNDLPIYSGFLPLIQRISVYLANKNFQDKRNSFLVGDSLQLHTKKGSIRIKSPTNQTIKLKTSKNKKGKAVATFSETNIPGLYRVFDDKGDEDLHQNFVVNLNTRGSNISEKGIFDSRLKNTLNEDPPPRKQKFWHFIAFGLLCILLVESFLSYKKR